MNQKEVEAKIAAFLPEDAYSKDEIIAFLVEDDEKLFEKAFPNIEQRAAITALFSRTLDMLKFHTEDDESAHEEYLGKKLANVDAKLRNHRHELDKTYSAKADF
jgi:hypothetical protein